jgi:hypothetical protein
MKVLLKLLFFSGIFLISCESKKNDDFGKISRKYFEKKECEFTLESNNENGLKVLNLKFNIHKKDDNFYSKILLLLYSDLQKNNYKFDSYIIRTLDGKKFYELTNSELSIIQKKKKNFDSTIIDLSKNNFEKIYLSCDQHIKTETTLSDFSINLKDIALKKYPVFDGYRIVLVEGEKYVFFKNSNKKNDISIMYKIDYPNNNIFGITASEK